MRHVYSLAVLLALLPLTACGGGGSSSSPPSPPSPPPTPPPAPIPTTNPPGATTIPYGVAPQEFGDLRLPSTATFGAGPYPVAVIVHGGCWTSGVGTLVSSASLADALTKRGVATWNIEYRAIGDPGGGFPGTFQDWSAATDYVRTLAATYPLDLGRVIVVGHSAGGHAALWLAARHKLAPTKELADPDPLPMLAAVDLDGPGELRPDLGYNRAMCNDAADRLMGGTETTAPDHFAQASPSQLLPFGLPQTIVSATFVPLAAAQRYRDMAAATGDSVTIIDQTNSGHYEMITPGTPQEVQVETVVVNLLHP